MKQPQSFIFIGRSGCGKGTQAKLLIEHLASVDSSRPVLYIETGSEFRDFLGSEESYTKRLAKEIADKGGLIPEFLAIHLWSHKLISGMTANQHLIIDGSPRKYDEALVLDSVFDLYPIRRAHVIYINVGEEWARGRLTSRARVDDGADDVENRFKWFTENVMPAIEYYRKNPAYTFHEIDGERPIFDIQKDIRAFIST